MSDTLEKNVNICEHKKLMKDTSQCTSNKYCPYQKQIGKRHFPDFKIICTYTIPTDDVWK